MAADETAARAVTADVETLPAPRPKSPMCAVCGKPVESFAYYDDEHVRHRYFIVKCHGRRQRVRVDLDTMAAATNISFGLAFADEQRRLSVAP